MTYLGTYTITPNTVDIEVECYGEVQPGQRETLEQEGLSSYAIVEVVKHGDIDISDYISTDIFDYLYNKVNEK